MEQFERKNPFSGGGFVHVFVSKDGKEYPTRESAIAADQAFDNAMGGSTMQARQSSAGGGGISGDMTAEFLKKWGKISDASLKLMEKAVAGIENIGDAGLGDTIKMLQQQAEEYAQKYGGLEQESIDATRQAIKDKLVLQGQLMKGTKADIAGVTGRAAADVQGESEAARAAQAREAMSYGVDPTSGKFGALTNKSFMDQARNTAIAMDVARRGETTRALGETKDAMQLISPNEYNAISQGIAQGQQGYYQNIGNLQNTAGQLQIAKAGAIGNIASGMYGIGQDYGSAGMGMYGVQQGYSGGAYKGDGGSAGFAAGAPEYQADAGDGKAQGGAINAGRDESGNVIVNRGFAAGAPEYQGRTGIGGGWTPEGGFSTETPTLPSKQGGFSQVGEPPSGITGPSGRQAGSTTEIAPNGLPYGYGGKPTGSGAITGKPTSVAVRPNKDRRSQLGTSAPLTITA